MPRYRVMVSRSVSGYRSDYADVEVDAESPREAKKKVNAEFSDSDFEWIEGENWQESDSDCFEVQDVELSENQPDEDEEPDDTDDDTEEETVPVDEDGFREGGL